MSRRGSAKFLLNFTIIEEIDKTQADSRSAPPTEITEAYGASACENAIRIHENPPKGKSERTSSMTSKAGINQKMLDVYRPNKPSGR
jgi:hypothetical protein